jgi:hypothetical protein
VLSLTYNIITFGDDIMIKNVFKVLLVLILVLIPILGLADTIYLLDGSVIIGEILEITDDTVTIKTKMGILEIDKENIERIEFEELPEEEIDDDEKLREEIKESLKDMVDEENIVIIIIKEEEKEDEKSNGDDKELPENDVEDVNETEEDIEEETNQDNKVDFHNESENQENIENNDNDITDWEYDYDNEKNEGNDDDYNWADDEGHKDNSKDKDHDVFTTPVFSLGFSSIGYLDDYGDLLQFGFSFRYIIDGWIGINGDINLSYDYIDWTSFSVGMSLLVPNWKFTPIGFANVSYEMFYDYYYENSFEGLTGSVGGGFEWFIFNWMSLQWYIKKYFVIEEEYGNSRVFEQNLFTGIVLYINF